MRKLGAAFRNWLMFTSNLGDMIQLDSYFKGNLRKGEVTLVSFLGVRPVDVFSLTTCFDCVSKFEQGKKRWLFRVYR